MPHVLTSCEIVYNPVTIAGSMHLGIIDGERIDAGGVFVQKQPPFYVHDKQTQTSLLVNGLDGPNGFVYAFNPLKGRLSWVGPGANELELSDPLTKNGLMAQATGARISFRIFCKDRRLQVSVNGDGWVTASCQDKVVQLPEDAKIAPWAGTVVALSRHPVRLVQRENLRRLSVQTAATIVVPPSWSY